MSEPIKITMDELKTIIATRLRTMATGVFANDIGFTRVHLINDLPVVQALAEHLRHGAEHTIVTVVPIPVFASQQENADAVDELFTERGV